MDNILVEYSSESSEMGEEARRKDSNTASVEDGEIKDTPVKKKMKNLPSDTHGMFGRWESEDSQDDEDGEGKGDDEVFEETGEKKMEEEDDDIQVIYEVAGDASNGKLIPKIGGTSSAVATSDDLGKANERIDELASAKELAKQELIKSAKQLETANAKVEQLGDLLSEALKKIRVAELRAEDAEKQLAAAKQAEETSKWVLEERQNTIKCQLMEMKALSETVEELKADKRKLTREVESERRARESAERAMRDETRDSGERRRSGAVATPSYERMTDNLEEMRKELEVTRALNRQIATISLGEAVKELEELRAKNMVLEEQVRTRPIAGTSKEVEELKKRNALLLMDNLELKSYKQSRDGAGDAGKADDGAILQQRDQLADENRELRSKVQHYESYLNGNAQALNLSLPPPGVSAPPLIHILSPPPPPQSASASSSIERPSVPPRFAQTSMRRFH